MQMYILSKDPYEAALKIPNKWKFKMLIELAQMISTLTNNGIYKPVNRGKEIIKWIDNNREWTYNYYTNLLTYSIFNINMKSETKDKLKRILQSLDCNKNSKNKVVTSTITNAVFRYNKEYICNIPTNSLLEINTCINEYEKYINWKLNKGTK